MCIEFETFLYYNCVFDVFCLQLKQALPAEFEAKLNKIHEMIPQEAQMVHASVYLKMLGNELGYISLEDIKGLIPRLNFTVANIKTVAKKVLKKRLNLVLVNL